MIEIIKESVKNYLLSLEANFNECKTKNIKGFVSKIEINGDKEADIYVVIPKRKLEYVAKFWFGEPDYDIKDLTNEIVNLIIGNAKKSASEKNIYFNISTPEFLGEFNKNIEYDDVLSFKYKNICFYILFKEK